MRMTDNMGCDITDECLCSYLDGEINAERKGIIETHLKSCQLCRKELETQKYVKLLIKRCLSNQTAPNFLRQKIKSELSKIDEYRESGIETLDLIRWGSHIAQLYQDKADMLETIIQYMEKGLEEDELCIWITSDISELEAKDTIAKKVPNLNDYISKQQLQLFSYKDWYLTNGLFNVDDVLSKAFNKSEEAISKGYKGLRAAGTLSWLNNSDWEAFMKYESLINNKLPESKALIVCIYKDTDYTPSKVEDIVKRHKYLIYKKYGNWQFMKCDRSNPSN